MPSTTALDDRFWCRLLDQIDKGRVVPIVGPEAVVIDGEDGPRPLNHYLARWTEEGLQLERTEAPTLTDVACRFVAAQGRIDDVYWEVKASLERHRPAVPDALRKLARIDGFSLFVTTGFDDLLRRAIDDELFEGRPTTQVVAYSLPDPRDLPSGDPERERPTVYHLLGKVSETPDDYALTEEDTLEFVHSLQSRERSPNNLLDELRKRSLLIIGCGYSDWLARFFLRIAMRQRLRQARDTMAVVADTREHDDLALDGFLRSVRALGGSNSADTRVFNGGAVEFIDQLASRWETHSSPRRAAAASAAASPAACPTASVAAAPTAAAGANPDFRIFVSYASEDREDAAKLAAALEALNVPVWFDRERLEGGDLYEREICEQIERAALFVPLLSPHVDTPAKRFFRKEWRTAIKQAEFASDKYPFIIPVSLPGVSPKSGNIPDDFDERHWLFIGRDDDHGAVAGKLRDIYRKYLVAMARRSA
jgi:hypothetical protein